MEVNKPILSLIRGAEAGKRGYDAYYSGSVLTPSKPLTQMTLDEVHAWQKSSVRKGSKSSAAGGYQMINETFNATRKALGLSGDTLFTEETQDRMGMHLMHGRGYNKWLNKQITDEQFIDNLAMEWAGFPRASGPKRGRSHYAGDGLNANTVNLETMMEGLNAGRNGTDWVFQGHASGASATQVAQAKRRMTLDSIDPNTTGTGLSLDKIASTPVPGFRSTRDDDAAQEEMNDKPGIWEATKMAVDENWIATNVYKQANRADFDRDYDFQFTDELWSEVTQDIPETYHDVFNDAVSPDHARALAKETKKAAEVDAELSKLGLAGMGIRMGAAMADPIALAVSVKSAGAATPFVYGNKAGKIARFLRAGAVAGASNAAIEAYIVSNNPIMQWEQVGYSAAAGFVLVGAAGAIGRNPLDDAMAKAFADDMARSLDADGNIRVEAADGSVGAARVPQETRMSNLDYNIAKHGDAPVAWGAQARIDMVGQLKQNDNPLVRKLGSLLAEDAVGNADGSANLRGVTEKAMMDNRVRMTRFMNTYNDAFAAWTKENGSGGWAAQKLWAGSPEARLEFNDLVGRAVRRDIDETLDPSVRQVASEVKKQYGELLQWGRDKRIRGFENVQDNANYFSRRHNIGAILDADRLYGEGTVNRLVAESMMNASRASASRSKGMMAELDYEDAIELAGAYMKSIRNRKVDQFTIQQGISGGDRDLLTTLLRDTGMEEAKLQGILDRVSGRNDSADAGKVANAKRRVDLDETHSMSVVTPSGVKGKLSIEDLLDNDVERVFTDYSRRVVGQGYMEDALASFRVPNADGTMPYFSPSFDSVKDMIARSYEGNDLDTVVKKLDVLHNSGVGMPLHERGSFDNALRMSRDYNLLRVGGQLGFAQIPELANVISNAGWRQMFNNVPMVRSLFKSAYSGKFNKELMNEIEAIWGAGTDLTRHSPHVILDDISAGVLDAKSLRGVGRARFRLEQGKKKLGIISTMTHVNAGLQRMNHVAIINSMTDQAMGVSSRFSAKRLASLGIDDAMWKRIQAGIKESVESEKGAFGGRVKSLNWDKWEDVEAREFFRNAVDRQARKTIQENDIGNLPLWMTGELARTATQFRSFMVASHAKQLLNGVNQRDMMAFQAFMLSMFFGGLVYAGQTAINAQGRSDKPEFIEDMLNPGAIFKAGFQRSSFAGFVPMAADSSLELIGQDPLFNYRGSGLSNSIFGSGLGNPTLDLFTSLPKATGAMANLINPNEQFTERDLRRVTKMFAFQNAMGLRHLINLAGGTLPAK